ncbi:MAG: O-antigen ligase family protein [Proteobacteria bacterium]|nr:O-antigen ligase family protein [Pseudomonadota bacterium]
MHALGYRHSYLKFFPIKGLYFLFLGLLIFKTLHSIDPSSGLYALKTNAYKAFLLFLVGIECCRSPLSLRRLLFLFVFMGVYEGLDGVWQGLNGIDLIKGEPLVGHRLTGSMDSARVGNLMALTTPLAFALPAALPRIRSRAVGLILIAAACAPQLYLLAGSGTRSGMVGVAAALAAFLLIRRFRWVLPSMAALGGASLSALIFNTGRLSIERLMSDHRLLDVWPIAWGVFKKYPLLGTGLNTFDKAYKMLGFTPHVMKSALGHPHNIYLQFLCETGIVGFAILLLFLGGTALWSARRIREGLDKGSNTRHWIITAAFWSSYVGYLATAMTAHNFFRSWWLGLAMTILGVTLGACLHGLHLDRKAFKDVS